MELRRPRTEFLFLLATASGFPSLAGTPGLIQLLGRERWVPSRALHFSRPESFPFFPLISPIPIPSSHTFPHVAFFSSYLLNALFLPIMPKPSLPSIQATAAGKSSEKATQTRCSLLYSKHTKQLVVPRDTHSQSWSLSLRFPFPGIPFIPWLPENVLLLRNSAPMPLPMNVISDSLRLSELCYNTQHKEPD